MEYPVTETGAQKTIAAVKMENTQKSVKIEYCEYYEEQIQAATKEIDTFRDELAKVTMERDETKEFVSQQKKERLDMAQKSMEAVVYSQSQTKMAQNNVDDLKKELATEKQKTHELESRLNEMKQENSDLKMHRNREIVSNVLEQLKISLREKKELKEDLIRKLDLQQKAQDIRIEIETLTKETMIFISDGCSLHYAIAHIWRK